MAFDLLAIAQDGYLSVKHGRVTIGMATRGYIMPAVVVVVPPKRLNITQHGWTGPSIDRGEKVKLNLKDIPLREYNEEMALMMIKVFLKCQDEEIL